MTRGSYQTSNWVRLVELGRVRSSMVLHSSACFLLAVSMVKKYNKFSAVCPVEH